MKITVVTGKKPFTAEASGTKSYVEGLIRNLSKKDIDIILINPEIHENEQKKYNIEHFQIKIKKATSIGFLAKLMVKTPFLKLPKDTIVHTHRPDFMFPFTLFSRKNPKVCTLHGIPSLGIKTRKNAIILGIYDILERSALTHIDKLIAVNQSTKDYFISKYPRLKSKISVIPVGIDLEMFKPKDKNKVRNKYGFAADESIILFIGRLSQEKGLDLLLRGFSDLKHELPKARLILVGEGPEGEKIRKTVEDQNIEGVTLMKPLKHEKIPEIINCADTLALCSLYEGMPTVVLEALACGVPVVSTDVGDVKKVVKDDITGQLIKDRSPDSIKNAILNVMRDGRESYNDNCIAVARQYSWEKVSEKIVALYTQVEKNRHI
ncbi:MAG: glycosyltransferase family 4 protein [Thermoplasmata archaeon]|nr:MAG: glycosyltransferase family 4 protein [Thermoplasmata archaeon]